FFFSSRRRHTRSKRDWSSDVCSSDLKNSVLFLKSNTHFALLVQFIFILLHRSQHHLRSVSGRSHRKSRSGSMPEDRMQMPGCSWFRTESGSSAVPAAVYSALYLP